MTSKFLFEVHPKVLHFFFITYGTSYMLDEPHVRTLSTVKSLNILTAFNVVYLTMLFMTLNTQDKLVSMFITQHGNMTCKR